MARSPHLEASDIERFLVGRMEDPDREAFERHFFECSECFEGVQAYRSLQAGLQGAEAAIRLEGEEIRTRSFSWSLRWAAAAGVFLLAVMIGLRLWHPAPPARTLAQLAVVDPPTYSPPRLRGTDDRAQLLFREAMKEYSAGDFAAAIPGLEAAAELDPSAPHLSFYLGICYLLTEQNGLAVAELRRTVEMGETPYVEEARLLLAKGQLRLGDVEAARRELGEVSGAGGELAAEADALLNEIEVATR